jgi:hypothetical protein
VGVARRSRRLRPQVATCRLPGTGTSVMFRPTCTPSEVLPLKLIGEPGIVPIRGVTLDNVTVQHWRIIRCCLDQ